MVQHPLLSLNQWSYEVKDHSRLTSWSSFLLEVVAGLAGPCDENIPAFSSSVANLRLFFPLTYLQTCLSLSSPKPTLTPGHSLPALPAVIPRSSTLFCHSLTQRLGVALGSPILSSSSSSRPGFLSLGRPGADSALWAAPSCLSCSLPAPGKQWWAGWKHCTGHKLNHTHLEAFQRS